MKTQQQSETKSCALALTGTSFQVTDDNHHRLFLNCLRLGELGMNQSSAIVGFDHEGVRQFTGTERLQ